jgi:hypothetical protein
MYFLFFELFGVCACVAEVAEFNDFTVLVTLVLARQLEFSRFEFRDKQHLWSRKDSFESDARYELVNMKTWGWVVV